MASNGPLKGKVAIITGSSKSTGIGAAIATVLAKQGANVRSPPLLFNLLSHPKALVIKTPPDPNPLQLQRLARGGDGAEAPIPRGQSCRRPRLRQIARLRHDSRHGRPARLRHVRDRHSS